MDVCLLVMLSSGVRLCAQKKEDDDDGEEAAWVGCVVGSGLDGWVWVWVGGGGRVSCWAQDGNLPCQAWSPPPLKEEKQQQHIYTWTCVRMHAHSILGARMHPPSHLGPVSACITVVWAA